jgi:transcriptional regulator of arginine metabolism
MGLRKLPEGVYVLAEDLHLQRMIVELVTGVVHTNNLVLIKASPGTAPGVAAAMDAADLEGILGSIAGDDTILVITVDEDAAQRLQDQISKFRGE